MELGRVQRHFRVFVRMPDQHQRKILSYDRGPMPRSLRKIKNDAAKKLHVWDENRFYHLTVERRTGTALGDFYESKVSRLSDLHDGDFLVLRYDDDATKITRDNNKNGHATRRRGSPGTAAVPIPTLTFDEISAEWAAAEQFPVFHIAEPELENSALETSTHDSIENRALQIDSIENRASDLPAAVPSARGFDETRVLKHAMIATTPTHDSVVILDATPSSVGVVLPPQHGGYVEKTVVGAMKGASAAAAIPSPHMTTSFSSEVDSGQRAELKSAGFDGSGNDGRESPDAKPQAKGVRVAKKTNDDPQSPKNKASIRNKKSQEHGKEKQADNHLRLASALYETAKEELGNNEVPHQGCIANEFTPYLRSSIGKHEALELYNSSCQGQEMTGTDQDQGSDESNGRLSQPIKSSKYSRKWNRLENLEAQPIKSSKYHSRRGNTLENLEAPEEKHSEGPAAALSPLAPPLAHGRINRLDAAQTRAIPMCKSPTLSTKRIPVDHPSHIFSLPPISDDFVAAFREESRKRREQVEEAHQIRMAQAKAKQIQETKSQNAHAMENTMHDSLFGEEAQPENILRGRHQEQLLAGFSHGAVLSAGRTSAEMQQKLEIEDQDIPARGTFPSRKSLLVEKEMPVTAVDSDIEGAYKGKKRKSKSKSKRKSKKKKHIQLDTSSSRVEEVEYACEIEGPHCKEWGERQISGDDCSFCTAVSAQEGNMTENKMGFESTTQDIHPSHKTENSWYSWCSNLFNRK